MKRRRSSLHPRFTSTTLVGVLRDRTRRALDEVAVAEGLSPARPVHGTFTGGVAEVGVVGADVVLQHLALNQPGPVGVVVALISVEPERLVEDLGRSERSAGVGLDVAQHLLVSDARDLRVGAADHRRTAVVVAGVHEDARVVAGVEGVRGEAVRDTTVAGAVVVVVRHRLALGVAAVIDLVVQVAARGVARGADRADHLPLPHLLPELDEDVGHVSVEGVVGVVLVVDAEVVAQPTATGRSRRGRAARVDAADGTIGTCRDRTTAVADAVGVILEVPGVAVAGVGRRLVVLPGREGQVHGDDRAARTGAPPLDRGVETLLELRGVADAVVVREVHLLGRHTAHEELHETQQEDEERALDGEHFSSLSSACGL